MAMSLFIYPDVTSNLRLLMVVFLGFLICVSTGGAMEDGVLPTNVPPEMESSDQTPTVTGEEVDEELLSRQANKESVASQYVADMEKYKDDAGMMVRMGLLANRKKKWIRLWGEGLPMNRYDPLEFFLIAENSGHGYEALALSFAKPLDIYRALEFIGIEAGRPVNYDELQLWPKGERLFITYEWTDDAGDAQEANVEKLVVDARTGKTLPVQGLAFVGSIWQTNEAGEEVLAVDAYDPHSIASDYNEPFTLFDVPRRAVDGEVYSYQRLNPDQRLPAGGLLEIWLKPEYPDGRKRVMNLSLQVSPGTKIVKGLKDVRFVLKDEAETSLLRGGKLKHLLSAFGKFRKKGRDPFVSISWDADLSLNVVQELTLLLAGIATDKGIRIEPPPTGQLFYRAFLPSETFRKRETRPSQPWELHLEKADGAISARLIQIHEIWKEELDVPELTTDEFVLNETSTLRSVLDEQGPGIPVILVYCSADVTYGDLQQVILPVLDTHPTIYVFLPKADQ